MNELLPCRFCGEAPDELSGGNVRCAGHTFHESDGCYTDCPVAGFIMTAGEWNLGNTTLPQTEP